ncbi:GntR family transcriptional regulator [Nocardiopsis sp. MG754419]|uniref:GntR family transcriptional regulator n=1 Tax=Nocardiopsis sp. MG754419 TaxID=2259865 RepID=UPI001BA70FAC|nr:GntR family transcriptional regulator [Nocardiopsis sp. MG754419]
MARPQLSDEVAAHVRELVLTGQLRAGEFVRVEKLAEDLGMSITPVREGLLALRGEGILTLAPRRGFLVAPLSEQDLLDLFWVQAQLAGELAARATPLLDDEQIAELGELQEKLVTALGEGDLTTVERLNHEFHRTVNRAAGSTKLAWFLKTATRYVPLRYYQRVGGWPDATRHDHFAVLEAFRARDPEAARAAMVEHIRHAGRLLAAHADLPEDTGDGTTG